MKRSGFKKFFAVCMLVVLTGTIVSKDLYHLILPHQSISKAYAAHLSDPNTTICNDVHVSECYLCHFEFSTGTFQVAELSAGNRIALSENSFHSTGLYYTNTVILNHSLRAPPAVI